MYQNEAIISKLIVTQDGEKDFQIRFIRDENVGIICTPTDKSYFLLDSADYWYDLIQEKYPPIMKCSCKNDRFNLTFEYTPREGTEDFQEINITCSCTVCQKVKRLPTIEIDYSPSSQLLDHPITFCKQPKIKYKTYSLMGYWSDDELLDIASYFLNKNLFVYCWYLMKTADQGGIASTAFSLKQCQNPLIWGLYRWSSGLNCAFTAGVQV